MLYLSFLNVKVHICFKLLICKIIYIYEKLIMLIVKKKYFCLYLYPFTDVRCNVLFSLLSRHLMNGRMRCLSTIIRFADLYNPHCTVDP